MLSFFIKLTKDFMETFNDDFISDMQWSILPLMEQISLYKCKVPAEDRGKTYFIK